MRSQSLRPIFLTVFVISLCCWVWIFSSREGQDWRRERPTFFRRKAAGSPSPRPSLAAITPAAAAFPKKIWQSWKTSVADLADKERSIVQTWRKLNPEYRFELLTDEGAGTYVRDRFADQPAIIQTYFDLSDRILRADLLRYLILLADGGVYTDVDTVALKSVRDWVPAWYAGQARLVVGIEVDEPYEKSIYWPQSFQLCQWTIMAQPGHPVMRQIVTTTIEKLQDLARAQNTTVNGIEASYRDVLTTTGPSVFTAVILDVLARQLRQPVSWRNLTGLREPKLLGDVLVLPVTGFAPDQTHSHSGSSLEETALVKHLFKGSWKVDHPMVEEQTEAEFFAADHHQSRIVLDPVTGPDTDADEPTTTPSSEKAPKHPPMSGHVHPPPATGRPPPATAAKLRPASASGSEARTPPLAPAPVAARLEIKAVRPRTGASEEER